MLLCDIPRAELGASGLVSNWNPILIAFLPNSLPKYTLNNSTYNYYTRIISIIITSIAANFII